MFAFPLRAPTNAPARNIAAGVLSAAPVHGIEKEL
jgi:hypothetical protein